MADKDQKGPARAPREHHRGRSSADHLIIQGLLVGGTIQGIAQHAHVSEKTVRRRLESEAFQRRLEKAKQEQIDATTRKISRYLTDALDCLYRCLSDPNGSVCVAAARSLLEVHFRAKESADFEERLAQLESEIGDDRSRMRLGA
jgi:hypothetical protein